MLRAFPVAVAVAVTLGTLTPRPARAQAELAPEGYVPPGKREPEPPPPSPLKWHIAADGRAPVALRQGPGLPSVGWGAGVQVTRALVDFGRIRFGVGADFGYARFSPDLSVPSPDFSHHLAHMTFAGLLVFDAIVGIVRPWFAVGAGVSAAWFYQRNPDPMQPPADVRTVVPVVELEVGVALAVYRGIDIGLAGHLDLTFSSLSAGFPPSAVFAGGMFSPRLEVGFRF